MFDFNFVTVTYIVSIILPLIYFFFFLATRFKMTDIESDTKYLLEMYAKTDFKVREMIESLNMRVTSLEDSIQKLKQKTKK